MYTVLLASLLRGSRRAPTADGAESPLVLIMIIIIIVVVVVVITKY